MIETMIITIQNAANFMSNINSIDPGKPPIFRQRVIRHLFNPDSRISRDWQKRQLTLPTPSSSPLFLSFHLPYMKALERQ